MSDAEPTAHPITAFTAAEVCIAQAIRCRDVRAGVTHSSRFWSDYLSIARFVADELRRNYLALADIDRVWRDTDTASLNALMHRAEKAEQERDQFRSQAALFQSGVVEAEQERDALRDQLNEAKLQNVLHLDRIDALLTVTPMTTVDEDGRVWRVEIVPNGEAQSHMPSDTWRAARLVPVEADS